MKYEIGDKATVRNDLKVGHHYGCDTFVPDMDALCGKTVKVKVIGDGYYILEEDKYQFYWTEEMLVDFVPLAKEMFEKLGYTDDTYENETRFKLMTNGLCHNLVWFAGDANKHWKSERPLTIEETKACIQQLKELGWIE